MTRIDFQPWICVIVWLSVFISLTPGQGMALDPGEILIVANKKAEEGVALAHYYAKQRQIPPANLLLLNLPVAETCSRKIYERQVAVPVRSFLSTRQPPWRIRCLLLMYGMPLRVAPGKQADDELAKTLKAQEQSLKAMLEDRKSDDRPEPPSALAEQLEDVQKRLDQLKITSDYQASLDSELCVVRSADAPVGGWIENPFYIGLRKPSSAVAQSDVLMVSRLDGPSAGSVKRIIDDAIFVEKRGLAGVAYFDARWPLDPTPPTSGYKLYDRSIHQAANLVEKSGRMSVVIDSASALFQPGQCPKAALYCGWYSLASYVDSFDWQRGAVGFHIASSECTTLKKENSQVWCKRMLEEGVCATVGPVGEPYVQAFPVPELFFGFLTEGVLSLGECYMVSLPYLSWKMVLIGDPLYRPFGFIRPRKTTALIPG